jgi:hypothetical protein
MRAQITEDDGMAQTHSEMLAREDAIWAALRARAREIAEDVREQRAASIAQRADERKADLADQLRRDAELEEEAQRAQRRIAADLRQQNVRENEKLIEFRERMRKIDAAEDRKIRELAIAQMDVEEQRRDAEERRKRERLLAREKLIEGERKRQEETRGEYQDFLDKQIAEQNEKDFAEIRAMQAKRKRLLQEKRRDFLESVALKEQREKEKKGTDADEKNVSK